MVLLTLSPLLSRCRLRRPGSGVNLSVCPGSRLSGVYPHILTGSSPDLFHLGRQLYSSGDPVTIVTPRVSDIGRAAPSQAEATGLLPCPPAHSSEGHGEDPRGRVRGL